MDDVTRRQAMKLAATTGAVTAVMAGSTVANAQESKKKKGEYRGRDQDERTSGENAIPEGVETLEGRVEAKAAPEGQRVTTLFISLSPDAKPGSNIARITGFPAGTNVASAWITEGGGHAGDAIFNTNSVQLYNNGTILRVGFYLAYNRSLPSSAMVIYGTA